MTCDSSTYRHAAEPERTLVLGMGAYAFGRERRAARSLSRMRRIRPYFLITRWEDGSVSALLDRYGFAYERAPFGYLGRARLHWTLVTLMHLPLLLFKTVTAFERERCRTLLILELGALVNALPAVLYLRFVRRCRIAFYLGDTPGDRLPDRLLGRLVQYLGDVVVANAGSVRNGLRHVRSVSVVHNGVDLVRYDAAAPTGLRERAGWPADAVVVGFVGQFSETKGVEDFLDAAALVAATAPSTRFVLVGGINPHDPFQQALPELIRTRGLDEWTAVTGWVDDAAPLYADMDVLVVPSRHDDPAPNTNIEAMAAGVPVVATRVGGTPELVEDGVTAFLVDRCAPDQLASRIAHLVEDGDLRRRMGAAGQDRARACFDADRNAAAVELHLLGEAA